jgi:hypothetical protein
MSPRHTNSAEIERRSHVSDILDRLNADPDLEDLVQALRFAAASSADQLALQLQWKRRILATIIRNAACQFTADDERLKVCRTFHAVFEMLVDARDPGLAERAALPRAQRFHESAAGHFRCHRPAESHATGLLPRATPLRHANSSSARQSRTRNPWRIPGQGSNRARPLFSFRGAATSTGKSSATTTTR